MPPSVKVVNLAGEPLRGVLAERIHALGTVEHLWNLYGPSEDTTYSTYAELPAGLGRALDRPAARKHVRLRARRAGQPYPRH